MAAGGAVGVFLAPVIAPAFARLARPAMKSAVRAGLAVYQRGREAAAELMEAVEDVTAEVKAENGAADAPQSPATATSEAAPTVLKTAIH
jgi:hypothetical protein